MNRTLLGRILVLLVVSLVGASLLVDWRRVPQDALEAGDVAPRTVKAPVTFTFQDFESFQRQRAEAESAVLPVFVHQVELADDVLIQLRTAFANARALASSSAQDAFQGKQRREFQNAVVAQLERDLRIQLVEADVLALLSEGFAPSYEAWCAELVGDAMAQIIVADRSALRDATAIRVLTLGEDREERVVRELDQVSTLPEIRQQIALKTLNSDFGATSAGKAASTIARSMVRANLTYSPIETLDREKRAAQEVRLTPDVIKRGTVLFREGDTVTQAQLRVYQALQAQQGEQAILLEWSAYFAFLLLLLSVCYTFGVQQLPGFSRRAREAASAGVLFLLALGMARVVVSASESIADLIGYEADPSSVWFVAPIAGTVMLVRLLMGLSWAMVFTMVTALGAGIVMDLQALPVAFFALAGFTGAASVSETRERIAVLRAGLGVALVSALAVLVIHFLQLYVIDGEVTLATTMRPVWSMCFALLGGMLSSFLVLGLTPLFESVGFVTDYRLMELANLNHPLMRQLMLRAPGSYHHSVMVGSLAEAAAEAIGANALQAKVASYFHDIGKTLKPRYFVENQGKGGSRHTGLDPITSAQIIISHVTEGGRMAAEHNLPKPIQDNIWMHHGTGILQYFYAKASADGEVDEAPFRYPGPKPNTREAGIIMLADKVEAATRTIKDPTEDAIRTMISRIVSSVMADDQFSECPLTFKEIHTIADTFVQVLLGIHHQRIEYPDTAHISAPPAERPRREGVPREALITLELHPGDRPARKSPEAERPLGGPAPTAPVAQGEQNRPASKLPVEAPKVLRRRRTSDHGDEMPPPMSIAPSSTFGLEEEETEADYEAMAYLPGHEDA